MWYLQTDVLLRLFIACGAMILISGLSRLIFKKDFGPKVLVFASIAVIAYVSWQLAIAIVCYTFITFIFARILKPLKKNTAVFLRTVQYFVYSTVFLRTNDRVFPTTSCNNYICRNSVSYAKSG